MLDGAGNLRFDRLLLPREACPSARPIMLTAVFIFALPFWADARTLLAMFAALYLMGGASLPTGRDLGGRGGRGLPHVLRARSTRIFRADDRAPDRGYLLLSVTQCATHRPPRRDDGEDGPVNHFRKPLGSAERRCSWEFLLGQFATQFGLWWGYWPAILLGISRHPAGFSRRTR